VETRINNLKKYKTRRKELRSGGSLIEAIIWNHLKHRQAGGEKFRRQHSIGPYILDFYCPERNFAIEFDGQTHDSEKSQSYDAERTEYLKKFGIKILRIQNKEVLNNLEGVLKEVEKYL